MRVPSEPPVKVFRAAKRLKTRLGRMRPGGADDGLVEETWTRRSPRVDRSLLSTSMHAERRDV